MSYGKIIKDNRIRICGTSRSTRFSPDWRESSWQV